MSHDSHYKDIVSPKQFIVTVEKLKRIYWEHSGLCYRTMQGVNNSSETFLAENNELVPAGSDVKQCVGDLG